jgi:hypothetical protein
MLRDLRCATFVDAPGTFNALPWPLRVIFVRHDARTPTAALPSTAEGPARCVEACGLRHTESLTSFIDRS